MRRAPRGFTLIEVMVALVIFVIGAIAIIRIFPPALNAIGGSGDRSVASRLNTSELGAFATDPDSIPRGIYEPSLQTLQIVSGGNGPANMRYQQPLLDDSYVGAVVGNRLVNASLPDGTTPPDIDKSALAHLRYITGERHHVMSRKVSYIDSNGIPRVGEQNFVLTRYPYAPIADGDSSTKLSGVRVSEEGTLTGVKLNPIGELDFTLAKDEKSGASFSETESPPAPNRPKDSQRSRNGYMYYVSYEWNEALNGTDVRRQAVTDEPVTIPDDRTSPFKLPILPAFNPGATVLQARRIGVGSTVSIPQQDVKVRYTHLFDTNGDVSHPYVDLIPTTETQAGLGYVRVVNANVGDVVSVDYYVQDWSLITEDAQPTVSVVDASAKPPIKEARMQLAIKNVNDDEAIVVKKLFTAKDPTVPNLQSLYLVPSLDNTQYQSNPEDQRFYSTFDLLKNGGTAPVTEPTTPFKAPVPGKIMNIVPGTNGTYTDSSLPDGRIIFDATSNPGEEGDPSNPPPAAPDTEGAPQARVVYRTLNKWYHQLSVAAQSYVPFYNDHGLTADSSQYTPESFNPRERWREYYLDKGSGQLYFHPSEAGKTVLVTYEYNLADGTGYHIVTNSVVTVADDISANGAVFPGGATAISAPLSLPNGLIIGQTVAPNVLKAILSVKGASIQSRTAWAGGPQFQQSMLTGYRPQESQ